jgi:hypothetical protein
MSMSSLTEANQRAAKKEGSQDCKPRSYEDFVQDRSAGGGKFGGESGVLRGLQGTEIQRKPISY